MKFPAAWWAVGAVLYPLAAALVVWRARRRRRGEAARVDMFDKMFSADASTPGIRRLLQIPVDQICGMPVDELAGYVLDDMCSLPQPWSIDNWAKAVRAQYRTSREAMTAFSEAVAWLRHQMIIVPDLGTASGGDFFILARKSDRGH